MGAPFGTRVMKLLLWVSGTGGCGRTWEGGAWEGLNSRGRNTIFRDGNELFGAVGWRAVQGAAIPGPGLRQEGFYTGWHLDSTLSLASHHPRQSPCVVVVPLHFS